EQRGDAAAIDEAQAHAGAPLPFAGPDPPALEAASRELGRDREPEAGFRADDDAPVEGIDDLRCPRIDQGGRRDAGASLRVVLIADRVRETLPQSGRRDLPAPVALEPVAGLANGRGGRVRRAFDLRGHVLFEIADDRRMQPRAHAGFTSADQISPSASRSGSPCTAKISVPISNVSPASSEGTSAVRTSSMRPAVTKRPAPKFVT